MNFIITIYDFLEIVSIYHTMITPFLRLNSLSKKSWIKSSIQNRRLNLNKRIQPLNDLPQKPGPVIYWMSRDQRTDDNWALLYAQEQSFQRRQPLLVVFCMAKSFLAATKDHFNFMIKGLQEVNKNLQELQIPFVFLEGEPDQMLPHFIEK